MPLSGAPRLAEHQEVSNVDNIRFCPACGAEGLDVEVVGEFDELADVYCPACGWSGEISPDHLQVDEE